MENDVDGNTEERQGFFEWLTQIAAECARQGPVLVLGDLNTHVRSRAAHESAFIGPHLYSPAGELGTPSPHDGDAPETNRELLSALCMSAKLKVSTTFFQKSCWDMVTYVDRREKRPMARPPDPRYSKQLDLVLASQAYGGLVRDVRSLRMTRLGGSPHIPQMVHVAIPLVRRQPKSRAVRLPRSMWADKAVVSGITARLAASAAKLPTLARSQPGIPFRMATHGPFSPTNVLSPQGPLPPRGPRDLLISFDGSYDTKNPALPASWAFVAALGNREVFRRWGAVSLDAADPCFLGATHWSNQTAELTAAAEVFAWLLAEAPSEYLEGRVEVEYDSKYAAAGSAGDWNLVVNAALGESANSLWMALDPDHLNLTLRWQKSHEGAYWNELADDLATAARLGQMCLDVREMSLRQLVPAEASVTPAFDFDASAQLDPDEVYRAVVAVCQDAVRAVDIPQTQPRKFYHSVAFLRLFDECTAAWAANQTDLCLELDRKMKKQARLDKQAAAQRLVEERDWSGIRMMRPFPERPLALRTESGRLAGSAERAEVFARHYATQQWCPAGSAGWPELPDLPARPALFAEVEIPTSQFTPQELRRAGRTLKRMKAAGEDEVSNDILRILLAIPLGFTCILSLMSLCLEASQLPGEWAVAIIVALYKKHNPELPKNYRPIALCQSLYKLYTKLLEGRLRRALGQRLWRFQTGFQRGHSVEENLFVMLRTIELCRRFQGLSLYMLFLDWSKAYDRIHCEPMLDALRRLGVPQAFRKLVAQLYAKMTFYVRDVFGKSGTYSQETGLRQGDPLSCFLFICVMTVVMMDADAAYDRECSGRGWPNARRIREIVGLDDTEYADDANLMAVHHKALQVWVWAVLREARRYGLELNTLKSWLVCVNTPSKPDVVDLEGGCIPPATEAKTLGLTMGEKYGTGEELARRTETFFTLMRRYRWVWSCRIPKRRKVERFDALVSASVLWALHLRTFSQRDRSRLDALQARGLRRVFGVSASFVSRVSNNAVRSRGEVERYSIQVFRRQLALLGHIIRLPIRDPMRLVCFQPRTLLEPREPAGYKRKVGHKKYQGLWAQDLILFAHKALRVGRRELFETAASRASWHALSERLCGAAVHAWKDTSHKAK